MLIRLALAQFNPTVGDLAGNAARMAEMALSASRGQADVVVFPELALTGYPPEDLLLKSGFLEEAGRVLRDDLSPHLAGLPLISIVGSATMDRSGLRNSAVVLQGDARVAEYHKILLPNYGVFDERRYFLSGESALVLRVGELRVGVSICEDLWSSAGPTGSQAAAGARLILNCNASPYHMEKWRQRQQMLAERARANDVFIAYANMVGGQDELVFDGHSMVYGPDGAIIAEAARFQEELLFVDVEVATSQTDDKRKHEEEAVTVTEVEVKSGGPIASGVNPYSDLGGTAGSAASFTAAPVALEEEVYGALVLGVRDYVRKNGFSKTVLGLSGGIDSALVAAIAVDALGADSVIGVNMPSRYSSAEGIEDARRSAELLSIRLESIPIEPAFEALTKSLKSMFADAPPDVTEENLQARIRGNLVMALSNKFGWLPLTTGNKSEMACGYATLYGDMAGGFAVIKDVPKTLVFRLAAWRNRWSGADGQEAPFLLGPSSREVVPVTVIAKPPSAELRADQRDTDSLPPYEVLDPIIEAYVERDMGVTDIVGQGHERAIVESVARLIDRSEYKRRQAPPGVKITPKAFGRDRRMPITNGYRSE